MASTSKQTLPLVQRRSIDAKQGAVRAVRFNVDGNYCLSCGADKSVKLWNPETGTLLKAYVGHGFEVLDAAGSSDNSVLASGGMDKTVFLWDVETGKSLRRLRSHAGFVNAVCFSEDSAVIFSASNDATIRAWDARSRNLEPIQVMDEATDSVTALAASDHEILSGAGDSRVRRYDLRQGQLYADFVGAPVTSVAFSRDGQCTLASSMDSGLRLLDKENGQMLAEFVGHKQSQYKLDSALLASDAQVVSGSEDGKAYLYDLVEGSLLATLPHPLPTAVHSLAPHPTKQRSRSHSRRRPGGGLPPGDPAPPAAHRRPLPRPAPHQAEVPLTLSQTTWWRAPSWRPCPTRCPPPSTPSPRTPPSRGPAHTLADDLVEGSLLATLPHPLPTAVHSLAPHPTKQRSRSHSRRRPGGGLPPGDPAPPAAHRRPLPRPAPHQAEVPLTLSQTTWWRAPSWRPCPTRCPPPSTPSPRTPPRRGPAHTLADDLVEGSLLATLPHPLPTAVHSLAPHPTKQRSRSHSRRRPGGGLPPGDPAPPAAHRRPLPRPAPHQGEVPLTLSQTTWWRAPSWRPCPTRCPPPSTPSPRTPPSRGPAHTLADDLVEGSLLATLPHPLPTAVHSLAPHPTKQRLATAQGQRFFFWTPEEEVEEDVVDPHPNGIPWGIA